MIGIQLAPLARSIIEERLKVRPGESLCIVTDTQSSPVITQALATAANAVGIETVIAVMMPRKMGEAVVPPDMVKAAMMAADVIINQTTQSFGHTSFMRDLQDKGGRVLVMPNMTEELMLNGAAAADFQELKEITLRAVEVVDNGRQVRILTDEGTDITFSIEGRKALRLYSEVSEPGRSGAFPDGEAATAPVEGTGEGVIVDPYAIDFENIKVDMGYIKEPFKLEVREGFVEDVDGGSEAVQFKAILDRYDRLARNLGEFAITTNPKARPAVAIREAKKAWGLAHVGLGENRKLGGVTKTDFHLDIIFRRPTVIVDGREVVKDGKLLV